jgi:dipeptidyl aminopeptidase/acylaminoacyl peptidase
MLRRRSAIDRSFLVLASVALCFCASATNAAQLGPSDRELVEITDIDSLSLSPDGQFAVFRTEKADVARNTYILRWHSVDLSNGTVRDIGSGGDPIYSDPGSVQPETPAWAAGGRKVIFRALVDGAISLREADVTGAAARPLLVRDSDIEDFSATDGGRAILYKVGPSRDEIRRAERAEYDSGILVDPSVDLWQNLFRGGSINGRKATQRLVGYWYIRGGLLWRSPRQQWRLDLDTGADTPVGAAQPVAPITPANLLPPLEATDSSGDSASVTGAGTSERLVATLSGGTTVTCDNAACRSANISALVWRPGSHDLLVTVTDAVRRQSLYLWSPRTNGFRKIVSADGLLSGGRRSMFPCAVSATAALCVSAGPVSPPRVERIDLASGERRVLFDPNAELRASYHPTSRYLRWKIAGGREVAGVLLLPEKSSGKPIPLYLNYYLCEGFLRGGEGDEWPIPALLSAGFAVACVNSVVLPGPQDAVADDRTALDAVTRLVDSLSGEGIVDRTKVGMGGLSHGSEIALWVASHSDLIAALSVSSGQIEPLNYWSFAIPGSDIPAKLRMVWGLGAPDETPARWRLVSTALYADRIHSPVLFQLPEQEARRIPELYSRLAQSGTPTELYAFPDEDHIKVQPRHRLAVYDRNLDWFRYWLQDYRDPDPEKADEYRRWDVLRSRWRRPQRVNASTGATIPVRPSR